MPKIFYGGRAEVMIDIKWVKINKKGEREKGRESRKLLSSS